MRAGIGIGAAGVLFDVHLLEARVAPTVRVFFFRFEQLFVPGFVREGPCLAHHVIDLLAFAGRVAWIYRRGNGLEMEDQVLWTKTLTGNPDVAGFPVHAQLATSTSAATTRR